MKGIPFRSSHYLQLRIEGFALDRLLTQCLQAGIKLSEIRFAGELEMTLLLMGSDYDRFRNIVKSRYRITVLAEDGIRHRTRQIRRQKSTMIGLGLFLLILYIQSLFIAEIRIEGYSRIQESTIRSALAEAGFEEGHLKHQSLSPVLAHLYQTLDNISWVGITYEGSLARVVIAEGTAPVIRVEQNTPCNIVADREGYVERVIAREGKITASPGTYVKAGDVLITGAIPIESKVYGQENLPLVRYVHASGQVIARVLYRSKYYQEVYQLIQEPTGRFVPGLKIRVGTWEWDFGGMLLGFAGYESSVSREWEILDLVRPLPLTISMEKISEVKLYRQRRSHEEIKEAVNDLLMEDLRNKLPRNAQISNKSLKFSTGKNIIEISVLAEVLEQIGKEVEIGIGEPVD